MNSTNTTYLTGTNPGKITLTVPSSTTAFGTASSQLIVYMSNHPTIVSVPFTFQTIILGFVPPSISALSY